MKTGRKPTKKFWAAYGALYGKGTAESMQKFCEKKPRKKRRRDEELEQIKCVAWLDEKGIFSYHIRNGGTLNPIEGAKFKRMGVKRGVPDLCIPYARKSHHGLYIEFKKVDGKLNDVSIEQKGWLDFLNQQGYKAVVAFGCAQAQEIITDYFGL